MAASSLFLPVWEESAPCIQSLGVGWLLLYSYLCGKSLPLVYSPWVWMAAALFLPVWEESSPCIQPLGVGWLLLYSYLCGKSLPLV
jgi:hypothetical protein